MHVIVNVCVCVRSLLRVRCIVGIVVVRALLTGNAVKLDSLLIKSQERTIIIMHVHGIQAMCTVLVYQLAIGYESTM